MHDKLRPKPLPSNMLALMNALEHHGPAFSGRALITLLNSDDRSLVYEADQRATLLAAVR